MTYYSLVNKHNYRKSLFLMGKSTISTGPFSISKLLVITRGQCHQYPINIPSISHQYPIEKKLSYPMNISETHCILVTSDSTRTPDLWSQRWTRRVPNSLLDHLGAPGRRPTRSLGMLVMRFGIDQHRSTKQTWGQLSNLYSTYITSAELRFWQ